MDAATHSAAAERRAHAAVPRPTATTPAAPASRLGERLRSLRLAAGLTQTQVAGDRFSKEYISQIERGKTRPTAESIAWLAAQLGVDPAFLGSGVSTDLRGRIEALLVRAEALTESHRTLEAAELFAAARQRRRRHRLGRARGPRPLRRGLGARRRKARCARQSSFCSSPASSPKGHSSPTSTGPTSCSGSASAATSSRASRPLPRSSTRRSPSPAASELPCDLLRADILGWRSRCRRRQRDFEAAREDVEAALELARGTDDRRTVANTYFQASLVAERMGHWIASRNYAQQAKAIYQELNDERNVGRLMLNLGGLQLVLGKPEQAIDHLQESFALAVEAESQPDAAQALGSLATVHLQLADYDAADENARKALALLEGRDDFPDEVGQSHLVLGRSLLERDRLDEAEECFLAADAVFEQMASVGHRAGAWVARGDLARRRGDDGEAARLYRIAAEALQDIRF